MARKVTFTLDDQTVFRIEDAAVRLQKPKSAVVREAVAEYHENVGRLSETERQRLLGVIRGLSSTAPGRTARSVDREIADIRQARRAGSRRDSRNGRK